MIAAYIIPYILLVSTILIFRKCLIFYNWNDMEVKFPRIIIWIALMVSVVPFAGYLAWIALMVIFLSRDVKVRKNRFTDYWFN